MRNLVRVSTRLARDTSGHLNRNNVKVVRQRDSGKIEIYVNDMSKPIMRYRQDLWHGAYRFWKFRRYWQDFKVRLLSEAKVSTAGDPFETVVSKLFRYSRPGERTGVGSVRRYVCKFF